ncbi:MAG: radical SAM protein [Clostridia bacterium]|nr:radical SAM protein [Clostridia bacterium]
MTAYARCTLCPRVCGADRTKGRGVCGETDVLRVSRASLHLWEEPCLTGTNGSGTVFFTGCNLGCVYCQNEGISHGSHGKEITPDRLAEIFLELQAQGAENINLVTAVHFTPHVIRALDKAKSDGLTLPVVYNSGGYESVETLRMLRGYIDIYLPDCKYHDPALAAALSRAADYPAVAMAALKEMFSQVGAPVFDERGMMRRGMIVRHLVLPGHVDDSMAVLQALHDTFGDDVYVSIMNQYTPVRKFPNHKELSRKLTRYEYKKVTDFAASIGIVNGFLQYGEAAAESFIPDFDLRGV